MKLYEHQKEIVKADPLRCGLWLGTGTGKTRTALMLARGTILVICLKTQKEDRNWEREYKEVLLYQGGVKWKSENGRMPPKLIPRLTVMSKEEFRRDASSLPRFNTVIVDEAHTCLGVIPVTRQRNRKTIPKASQLYDELETYLSRTKPDRLYLCTATIVRSPMTVWAARRLLEKDKIKDKLTSFLEWREMFYTRLPMPGREVYAPRRDSKVKVLLARYVHDCGYVGRLEQYFDVPDQVYKTVYVELTTKQKAVIKELPMEFPDPIVLIGKRHQVENGVLAGDEFNDGETFDNGKIDKIFEFALEFPRMVIFAKYRAQIEQLRKALSKDGYTVATLTGDTKDRGELIKRANEAEECIFIAQAQISAGWELPKFPVMIFASRTYSFVDFQQGLGRIQRANNIKKNLYINLVTKGGIDEAVDKALINKQSFDERLFLGIK